MDIAYNISVNIMVEYNNRRKKLIEERIKTLQNYSYPTEESNPDTNATSSHINDSKTTKVITLEMKSNLPPLYRPDQVKGVLLTEKDGYYHVKDVLGVVWLVPKYRWKMLKLEVVKQK